MTPRDAARAARLLRMADARTLDTALVDSLLLGAPSWLRAQAVLAVGQVNGTARLGALRTLTRDADTAVGANAAFALGLMPDSASIDALVGALARPTPVAVEAAWSLGEIGAPARFAIERGLEAPPNAAPVRAALLTAAARLRPVPIRLIAPFLTVPEAEVRRAAAYAIARPRAKDGVRALTALQRDPDAGVRAQVALALAKASTGDSLGRGAVDALRRLIADKDRLVRTNAVRSLATHGEDQQGAVLGAFADPDPNVRVAAAQSVRFALRAESAEWDSLWSEDTTYMVRRELLLSAARSSRAIAAAAPWASDPDWRRRAAFTQAEAIRAPLAVRAATLAAALKDGDARVRGDAVQLLASMADSADAGPRRRDVLLPWLTDRDPIVRAAALDGLRGGALAADAAIATQSYREALEDSEAAARVAALRLLAAAWTHDSAAFGTVGRLLLSALPPSVDPLERAEVTGVSPLASWRNAARVERPLAFYDSVVRTVLAPAVGGRRPRARLVTERGALTIELFALDAPLTVHNFATLARRGYFKGTRFHRVVPNFVVQDGDPRGDGNGGPGYAIRDEFNRRRYTRGSIGMALSGPDTGGSQYFICHSAQPHLDGHYTVFGRIVGGEAILDRIVQGDQLLRVELLP